MLPLWLMRLEGCPEAAQRHQDGTDQGHPRRLGWLVEQSSNHPLRQIKGKSGGLPLMF